jgi:transcriptional regulator with XRE-family HTH domain
LRKEVGLTAEKLAYESDLGSKGYLSDIEKGLALPTVKTLRVIAERLGVLPLDLLTDPDADLGQIDRPITWLARWNATELASTVSNLEAVGPRSMR